MVRTGVTNQLVIKTLILGAIQLLYATKIKTDVHDETFAISARIVKAPNAKLFGSHKRNFVMIISLIAGTS